MNDLLISDKLKSPIIKPAIVIGTGNDIVSLGAINISSFEINDFCSGHFYRKFDEQSKI